VTAKDENNFKAIEVKILNRLSVDKFMEISTNMPMNRDLKISERDIFLLSRSPDPLGNKQEPHCLARVDRTNRKKDVIEVTFRVSRDIDRAFSDCLAPNTKIHALKIADMTTTQREFAALSSLDYYDLCNEVLEATPSPLQKYPDEKISLMSSKYKLNKGQAQAILSANDNDGFTLIQG
jgi:senataxin